jgi:hypothetical protein
MEAMLGISLFNYLYLKLAKTAMSFLSLMFSLQQNWKTREQNRFCLEEGYWAVWGVVQTMYTHISKCKNDKIKEREKNRAGGVAQNEGPEFKPQYHKKKKSKVCTYSLLNVCNSL